MPKRDLVKRIELESTGGGGAFTASTPASAKQYATFVVAASNSTLAGRDGADYVCTGSDDQDTINLAIAAKDAPQRVLLLEGTYSINASITLQDDVILEGQGDATTLKLTTTFPSTGAGSIVFNGVSFDNVILRNFQVDGSNRAHVNTISLSQSTNVTLAGLRLFNMAHWRAISHYGGGGYLRILNCRFNSCASTTALIDIYADAGSSQTFYGLQVIGCRFTDCRTGIVFSGDTDSGGTLPAPSSMSAQQALVADNIWRNSNTSYTFFSGLYASNIVFAANDLRGVSDGIGCNDCFDVSVLGNTIVEIDNDGVRMGNSYYADEGGGSRYYTITGNEIRESNGQCIALVGPPNSDGDGSRATEDYQAFAVITGNTLINAAAGNITLGTVSKVAVIGNSIALHDYGGSGTTGIEVVQSWEITITGNVISDELTAMLITESESIGISANAIIGCWISVAFGCREISVTGNHFDSGGVVFPNSGSGSDYIAIVGNAFQGGSGITNQHADTNHLAVTNNIFWESGSFGSSVAYTYKPTSYGNTFDGVVQVGIGGGGSTVGYIGEFSANQATIRSVNGVVPNWIEIGIISGSDLHAVGGDDYADFVSGALYIFSPYPGTTFTIKHGLGNYIMNGGADFLMDNDYDRLLTHFNGTAFVELSRSEQ